MSGHSKWATTKHRKAAVDAKRSKLFSKLSRIINVSDVNIKGKDKPEPASTITAKCTATTYVLVDRAKQAVANAPAKPAVAR
jgi:transcriptional/translational regulatory protein YebC/TACO1